MLFDKQEADELWLQKKDELLEERAVMKRLRIPSENAANKSLSNQSDAADAVMKAAAEAGETLLQNGEDQNESTFGSLFGRLC